MATDFRNKMREVMRMAWQMVKKNGYTMSEALKNGLAEHEAESINARTYRKVLLSKSRWFNT